eukprot:TRINITY_DN1545_c0_g3_i1.p1 TRINITY_DN1545_c0_g3~~TRINITY_DN1545_c0_g3_i1.p1  ORF type:complete len:308 (+),score=78.53 TRINITY_DN1545_c0_g3_i1:74-997(+)
MHRQVASSLFRNITRNASTASFNFSGKLALVTGSTLGIGRAIAENFYASGASVIINGRDRSVVDKTIREIEKKYKNKQNIQQQKLIPVAADVSSAAGSKLLCDAADALGSLDYLVPNVGIFGFIEFEKITDEEWMRYFNVNVLGTIRMCRHYLPKMLSRQFGRIVIISSECGLRPIGGMVHYSVTKTTQISLARGLAELTKGVPNVTVNSILPGPTWTEGVEKYMETVRDALIAEAKKDGTRDLTKNPITKEETIKNYFKVNEPTSLLQKYITPQQVADAVLFLCTDNAAAINGHAQRVDGGIIRHI